MEDKTVLRKAKNIRLLITDVDGVWTDGKLYYMPGMEGHMKAFHVRDGMAVRMAEAAGLHIAVISAKSSAVLQARCRELGIERCWDGSEDKLAVAQRLTGQLGLKMDEIAMIGDDLLDLPLLRAAGFSATVADAPQVVQNAVDYVSTFAGGNGAFRDIVELIIQAQDRMDTVLAVLGGVNELS